MLCVDFTLFVRFFDRYYVDTIPKSRFDSFLIFLLIILACSLANIVCLFSQGW